MTRRLWQMVPKNKPIIVFLETVQRDPNHYIAHDYDSYAIFSAFDHHVSFRYKHGLLQEDSGMNRKTYFVCKECGGWIRCPVFQSAFDFASRRFLPPNLVKCKGVCSWCRNAESGGQDGTLFVESPQELDERWTPADGDFHEYAIRKGLFDHFKEDIAKVQLLPLLRLRVDQLKHHERQRQELEHALF